MSLPVSLAGYSLLPLGTICDFVPEQTPFPVRGSDKCE